MTHLFVAHYDKLKYNPTDAQWRTKSTFERIFCPQMTKIHPTRCLKQTELPIVLIVPLPFYPENKGLLRLVLFF